jgi:hypothetical protein
MRDGRAELRSESEPHGWQRGRNQFDIERHVVVDDRLRRLDEQQFVE